MSKFGGEIVGYNLFFDTEKQTKDFIDFIFKIFDLPLLRKYNEYYFFIDILKNIRSLLKNKKMTLIVKIITENKKVGKIPTFYFFTNIYQIHFSTYHNHFF